MPKMNNQRGVAHLILILVVVAIIAVVILVFTGIIKLPSLPGGNLFQKKASVQLKSEYKNPFKKETQYVNPFETYKNPFVVAK